MRPHCLQTEGAGVLQTNLAFRATDASRLPQASIHEAEPIGAYPKALSLFLPYGRNKGEGYVVTLCGYQFALLAMVTHF